MNNTSGQDKGTDNGYRKSALLEILELILAQKEKIKIVSDLAFEAVDLSGDGNLDKEELGGVLKKVATKMGVTPPNEADVRAVLEELDEDNNDQVDKDEFEHLIVQVLLKLKESEEELQKTVNAK